jgi:hypothetical protein
VKTGGRAWGLSTGRMDDLPFMLRWDLDRRVSCFLGYGKMYLGPCYANTKLVYIQFGTHFKHEGVETVTSKYCYG